MILLGSDTETLPSEGMRKAMYFAELGDEQKGTDPTVNKLIDRVSELLGMESALFFPGGTMCNLVSIKAHTRPGDVVLVDELAHVLRAESAGPAFSSGVHLETVHTHNGIYSLDQLKQSLSKIRIVPGPYSPIPRLVVIEQAHNFSGGNYWDLQDVEAISQFSRDEGLKIHMDGARYFNACIASGNEPEVFAHYCDSLWIDFTKGLGAPMGAVLAGSRDFIAEARRLKHIFGGALRQAGVVAAACLYALDHNIERLAEDHYHAQYLAEKLAEMPGISVKTAPPKTNMVFFKPDDHFTCLEIRAALNERGIDIGIVGDHLRAVTHLNVSKRDILKLVDALKKNLSRVNFN